MVDPIRFDDLDALNALASDEFGAYGDSIVVTQEMINAFADLTGDHQWIHVDVERSKRESLFGGPIADGFLTLTLLPKLSGSSSLQLTGQASAVNYGGIVAVPVAGAGGRGAPRSRPGGWRSCAKSGGTLLTSEWDVRVPSTRRSRPSSTGCRCCTADAA